MSDKPVDDRFWFIESESEPGHFAIAKFFESGRKALLAFTTEDKAAGMQRWLLDERGRGCNAVPLSNFDPLALAWVLKNSDTEKVAVDLEPYDKPMPEDWLKWQSLDEFIKDLES